MREPNQAGASPRPQDALWREFRGWGTPQGHSEADLLDAYEVAVVADQWAIDSYGCNLMYVGEKDIRRYLFTLSDERARDEALRGLGVFFDFLIYKDVASDNIARAFLPGEPAA